jgi:hypothetical protein
MRRLVDGSKRCRDLVKRRVDQFRCDDAIEETCCKRFMGLVHLAKGSGTAESGRMKTAPRELDGEAGRRDPDGDIVQSHPVGTSRAKPEVAQQKPERTHGKGVTFHDTDRRRWK